MFTRYNTLLRLLPKCAAQSFCCFAERFNPFADFFCLYYSKVESLPQINYLAMKTKILLIRTAGLLGVFFTLFHAGFYWIFNWSQTLLNVNPTDKGILLTFNLIGIVVLVYSVIMSLVFAKKLIDSFTGKTIMLFFALFYIVRIVSEFLYFEFATPRSPIIIALCAIPALFYLLAMSNQTNHHA